MHRWLDDLRVAESWTVSVGVVVAKRGKDFSCAADGAFIVSWAHRRRLPAAETRMRGVPREDGYCSSAEVR